MNQLLPVGIEDFREMIDGNFFYIDKTDFIQDTFDEKVALFTRPRRFGKTLNLSMLQYFYSLTEKQNACLFDHLKISRNPEADRYRNRFPVIFLSLKDMTDWSMELSTERFSSLIQALLRDFPELIRSEKLNESSRNLLSRLQNGTAGYVRLSDSLRFLSECLYRHYGEKTVILIDEYDVPLNTAYKYGYYNEMASFIRSVFSSALKTNRFLEKAILTGCLSTSRESIFTGLNNFRVCSILDFKSSSAFGFTQQEVDHLFQSCGFSSKLALVRDWYDGYRFGNTEIYNPWSVLQYLKELKIRPDADPISCWANTSSNSIVMRYIQQADPGTKAEFEQLVNGRPLRKRIKPDLTFREMEDPDNIYSFLLLTGYLKSTACLGDSIYELMIPNKEVREIYITHFSEHFRKLTKQVQGSVFEGLLNGNARSVQNSLNSLLAESISFFDNIEAFYHGFMAGILTGYGYAVSSNREEGNGRPDLVITSLNSSDHLIIIECRLSETQKDLVRDAEEAVRQIAENRYLEDPSFRDYEQKKGYGISFCRKKCHVQLLGS